MSVIYQYFVIKQTNVHSSDEQRLKQFLNIRSEMKCFYFDRQTKCVNESFHILCFYIFMFLLESDTINITSLIIFSINIIRWIDVEEFRFRRNA